VTSHEHPLARRKSVDFAETLDDDYIGLATSSAIHSFITIAADGLGRRIKLRSRWATSRRRAG
jgi:hypothetical protein